MADPRFDTSRDPRFKRVPKNVSRVVVDKRFAHMFTDDAFAEPQKIDPRGGRGRAEPDGKKKDLREFYNLPPEDCEAETKQGKRGRRGRRRTVEEGEAKADADGGDSVEGKKLGRRGRRRAVKEGEAEVGADDGDNVKEKKLGRRGRRRAVEEGEAEADADDGDNVEGKKLGRRGRRRAVEQGEAEVDADDGDNVEGKKLGRRGRQRAAKQGDAEEKKPGRRGRRKAALRRTAAQNAQGKPGRRWDVKEESAEEESAEDADADSDTSSDEDDSEEEEEEEEDDEDVGDRSVWEVVAQDVPKGDATRRLAILRCDWDQITAGDLLVMLRTYLTSKEAQKSGVRTGAVERVRVYPSDYGLERMAKESQVGPLGEGQRVERGDDRNEDDEEDEDPKIREQMRRYQVERTKYYYAVADCDSVATASWLYDQMDGFDSIGISPMPLDLRFVPDDLEFPHAPHSEATELPRRYQGPVDVISAVGHSKVKCTWDEAPAQRKRDLVRKKFTAAEIAEMDLSVYLATSSEEEDAPDAEALRNLVRDEDLPSDDDIDRKEVMGDMEETFNLDVDKMQEEITEKVQQQSEKVHTLEQEVTAQKGTWQAYLDSKKAKRKAIKAQVRAERLSRREGPQTTPPEPTAAVDEVSRAELELITMKEKDGDDRGFNLRGPQRAAHAGKRNKHTTDDGSFRVDVNDPRIAKVFSSADFEIDPTNPQFRRTEGMTEVLQKKRLKKVSRAPLRTPDGPVAGSGAVVSSAPKEGNAKPAAGGLQLFARRAPEEVSTEAASEAKTAAPKPKKRKLKQG